MLVQYLYVVDNPICSTDPLGLLGESVSNWVQEKLYDAAEYLRQKVGDVTKHFTNPVRKSDLEMGIVASLLISAGDTSAMMLQALINTGRYMTGQLPSMEYFNSYLRTKSQINQYFLNRVSYTDSYYLGKSIGDIIGTAVGLGMTAKGISELLAGIGGIGSGVGAVALPICVAISAEGVVTAGAGVTVAAAAAGNFGGDFEKFQCEKKKYSRGDPKAKANWNKESTRCTSKTLYNKKGVRIDVENPNPTVRPGQVHVQTGNKKYIFDNVTKRFYDASNFDIAPKNIQNLLNDAEFVKKLNVGLEQYLGLQGVH
jgi:large exoprotein involved in heme utilization or adhesion